MKMLSLNGIWKYCLNDGEKYRDIQVPSNWYLQGLNHSGKVYYQKKFEISTQNIPFIRYFLSGQIEWKINRRS